MKRFFLGALLILASLSIAAAQPTLAALPSLPPAPTVTPAPTLPAAATEVAPNPSAAPAHPPLTAADFERLEPLYTIPLPGGASRFAFSPDGSLLAVFDRPAGKVTLYDAHSGEALRSFSHQPTLAGLAFGPDGQTLLTYGEGGELYLWDAQTFEQLASQPSDGGITAFALSPDGQSAAAYNRNRNLRLYDTRTLEQTAFTRPGYSRQPASILFSPDGRLLYIYATYDRQVMRFSLPRLQREIPFEFDTVVAALALDPAGEYLAAGLGDGRIQLARQSSGALVRTFSDRQTAPAWLELWGSRLILTAENGGGVLTSWRFPGGEPAAEVRVQPGESAAIHAVRLRQPSPDGRLMLLCADRRLLVLADDGPAAVFSLDAPSTRWDACAFSPAGDLFAALEWTRALTVFGAR